MARASLDELSAFLAIAEHGSFRRAAASLAVTPSAISHALRGLEDRVGVRLVHRSTRSVRLSTAGARFAERLRPVMTGLADAFDALADADGPVRGTVRISAMESGATWLIDHVLGPLAVRHPAVAVEIAIEPALVDLVAARCDAGMRLREQVPPDMVALPVTGPIRMLAVASPDYLRAHGTPITPLDLAAHQCIRQRLAGGGIYAWEFVEHGRPCIVAPDGRLTLGTARAITAAARQGLGIGFVPSPAVDHHLATGRLHALLERYSPPFDGLCLFFPADRHRTRAFAAFLDTVRVVRSQGSVGSDTCGDPAGS